MEKTSSERHIDHAWFSDRHIEAQRRLTLWSAIGNVGGLVAVGSVFAENFEKPALLALIFPSLWLFGVGTTAAVAFNIAMWNSYSSIMRSISETGQPVRPDGIVVLVTGLSGLIAGSCFVGGYLYPLIVFSIRYLQHGAF